MVWNEIAIDGPTKYLYRSTKNSRGYKLEITDSVSVWVEELDEQAVQARSTELGAVILLESSQDIDELFKLVAPCLRSPQATSVSSGLVRLEYKIDLDEQASQEWYFECKKVSVQESQQIVASLVSELFETISNLKSNIEKGIAQASQLEYHIWNLNRICEPGAYKPHRYQDMYYSTINRDRARLQHSDSAPPHIDQWGASNSPTTEQPMEPESKGKTQEKPQSETGTESVAFSKALAEIPRETTKEERLEKLERQLTGPKRKRRRF